MYKTKLSQGGRIVIPAKYRKAIGLEIGDEVVMRVEHGEITLSVIQRSIERAQDTVRQYVAKNRSLVKELISERRKAAKDE